MKYSHKDVVITARKVSKYGPENTPYLGTFHAVYLQKYKIHYQQKNFACLVCTRYIFHQAICQLRHGHSSINRINTTIIKLGVFRGLLRDLITV